MCVKRRFLNGRSRNKIQQYITNNMKSLLPSHVLSHEATPVLTRRGRAGIRFLSGIVSPLRVACVLALGFAPLAEAVPTKFGPVWMAPNEGNIATAVDNSGDVYVISNNSISDLTGRDFVTTKFNGNTGAQVWQVRRNGAGNTTVRPSAMVVDAAGDVIVTGSLHNGGAVANTDVYTVKYAGTTGAMLWEVTYADPILILGTAVSVAVDSAGDVAILARGSTGSAIENDFYTAKYNGATGALLWSQGYDSGGPDYDYDDPSKLVIDGSDNVIVTGNSRLNGGGTIFATIKYDPSGNLLWVKNDTQGVAPNGLAVDAGGNVIVTGQGRTGPNGGWYTVKYAAATGSLLWSQTYTGTHSSGFGLPSGIALGAGGDVFLTGQIFGGGGTNLNFATQRYNGATGAILWTRIYNAPSNGVFADNSDVPSAIKMDAAGNVLVTGHSQINFGFDQYTAVYDQATGAPLWEHRIHAGASPSGSSLAIRPGGQIVLAMDNNVFNYDTVIAPIATETLVADAQVSGEPLGTIYKTFGVPSINDAAEVAVSTMLRVGMVNVPAIVAGAPATVKARKGQLTPQVDAALTVVNSSFQSFSDPMLDQNGDIAFRAKVAFPGMTPAKDEGIWIVRSGVLGLVAQEQGAAAGIPGARYKSFTQASFAEGTVAFTAVLVPAVGGVIFGVNDEALYMDSGSGARLILRRGATVITSTGPKTLNSNFALLGNGVSTSGQGQGVAGFGPAKVCAQLMFPSSQRGIFTIEDTTVATEFALKGGVAPGFGPGVFFGNFGNPTQNDTGSDMAVVAPVTGAVPSANNAGIFRMNSGGTSLVVAKGSAATGTPFTFGTLNAPAINSVGTVWGAKLANASSIDDQGLWWSNGSSQFLLARESSAAPGASANFKAFLSYALPEGAGAGPIFTAQLNSSNFDNVGLWSADGSNNVYLALREGQPLAGKCVKVFTALPVVAGTTTQARSYNNQRQLVARVTYFDNTQAIVTIEVP